MGKTVLGTIWLKLNLSVLLVYFQNPNFNKKSCSEEAEKQFYRKGTLNDLIFLHILKSCLP